MDSIQGTEISSGKIIEEFSQRIKIWNSKIDSDCRFGKFRNYRKKQDTLWNKMSIFKKKLGSSGKEITNKHSSIETVSENMQKIQVIYNINIDAEAVVK